MKKYTLTFSFAYLVLALALGAIVELLKIKAGASFGIAATFAASFIAAWKFTKDHGRQPTLEEKKSYAWQALISVWAISLLLVAVAFATLLSPSETRAMSNLMATSSFLAIGVGVAVFISLVYYVAIRWSFAWYAKLACKTSHLA